jgi:hypothetical protein
VSSRDQENGRIVEDWAKRARENGKMGMA